MPPKKGRAASSAPSVMERDSFELLFKNHPVPMWIYDLETLAFLDVNDAAVKKYGYTRRQFLKMTLKDIRPAEDIPHLVEDLKKRRPAFQYSGEWRHQLKNGSVIDVEITAHTLEFEGRRCALVLAQDITGRKRAEAEIMKLHNAVEQSADIIFITARDGIIEYVNPAFETSTGYSKEESIGKSPNILSSGLMETKYYQKMWTTILSGEVFRGEIIDRKKNGEIFYYDQTITPLKDARGNITHFVSTGKDVTERKQAEVLLQSEKQVLEMIASGAELDKTLDVISRNTESFLSKAFCSILLMDRDGVHLRHGAAPSLPQDYNQAIDGLAIGEGVGSCGTAAYRKEAVIASDIASDPLWVDYRELALKYGLRACWSTPIQDESGKVYGTFAIYHSEPRAPRQEDFEIIRRATHQTKIILERKQAEAEISRQFSELETLYESGLAINRLRAPKEVAQAVIEILDRRMNWHHIAIRQYQPETNRMELIGFNRPDVSADEAEEYITNINSLISNPSQGLSGWVTLNGKSLRAPNVKADKRYVDTFPGILSGLYVPLKIGKRVIGSIAVESEVENNFNEQHERLLETLAGQAAIAIENASLFHEVRAELIERRLIEEQMRLLNAELEQRVSERTAQIETVKRRLELAAHAGQIGVWEYIPAENRVIWDERMRIIHHLQIGAFDGTPQAWAHLIHPDDLEKTGIHTQPAVTQGQDLFLNNEHRIFWPNGAARHIATSTVTVFADDGKAERVIGISMDVTERKKTEETLRLAHAKVENALRIKDEFLANMSHELRTPLNSIIGISESLEEQIVGGLNEKQEKYVRIIKESGNHLLELINDILDISKIEAGHMELDARAFSVEKLCQSSIRLVRELAQKKSQRISFRVKGNVEIISGDERRLKQSLVNLLSNAVKFTGPGKEIGLEVEGHAHRNEVTFTVWDEGAGIAQEDLQLIFKPFVQLDAGLAREYQGTGLGLALVAQMVRLQGGRVRVESELGAGSRFIITLPWGAQEQNAKAKVTGKILLPDQKSREKRKGRILLVEDTNAITAFMDEYLTQQGYQVFLAANGREGILLAKSERPHLILMDVMMPVMDGLEAAQIIRADKELETIPIVALTALAMPGDRERCLAAGMTDYLSKPIRMEELMTIIERHLPPGGQADEKQNIDRG